MGGLGSGRHPTYDAKTTVEQCLTVKLDQAILRRFASGGGTAALSWTQAGREVAFLAYRADVLDGGGRRLILCYAESPVRGEPETVHEVIQLVATPCHFGGQRWWFVCPLVVDGQPCGRRVTKLHLPPRARYFGCRHCHNLTYTSAQEAHKYDRLFAGIAAKMGIPGAGPELRRGLERRYRG